MKQNQVFDIGYEIVHSKKKSESFEKEDTGIVFSAILKRLISLCQDPSEILETLHYSLDSYETEEEPLTSKEELHDLSRELTIALAKAFDHKGNPQF